MYALKVQELHPCITTVSNTNVVPASADLIGTHLGESSPKGKFQGSQCCNIFTTNFYISVSAWILVDRLVTIVSKCRSTFFPFGDFCLRFPSQRSDIDSGNCSESDIDEAVQQGYGYYEKGQTVGSGGYPHQYNDYEGFEFPDSGPYYEFPILSSYNPYTGGSPGADRVIFTGSGEYEAVITHTGASGNDFLQCKVG